MADIFDEIEAPKRDVFDELDSPAPRERDIFDDPEVVDAGPLARRNLKSQIDTERRRLQKEAEGIEPFLNISPMTPISTVGDVVRGGLADLSAAASVFKRPQGTEVPLLPSPSLIGEAIEKNLPDAAAASGNLPAALNLERLPIDDLLADVSSESPAAATLGKVQQGIAGSAPLLAVMPQGALGKLVAAGFTADMLRHAGPEATALGEEMGKPPGERDMDRITTALSSLIQTTAFAPATGVHAAAGPLRTVGRAGMERFAPSRAAINELAKQLQSEPVSRLTVDEAAQVRSGLPPRAPAEPMLPELARTRDLMDQALAEAGQRIEVPGQTPAIDLLRAQEAEILPASAPPEFRPGGGRAVGGKVSFDRPAEASLSVVEAPTAEATRFVEEWSKPDAKVSNASDNPNAVTTTKTGMSLKSIADLDVLLEANNRARSVLRDLNSKRQRGEKLTPEETQQFFQNAGKIQFPREAVEVATNSGGWTEANQAKGPVPRPLGERPLDWQKNPEVAEWLRRHKDEIGIEIPEGSLSATGRKFSQGLEGEISRRMRAKEETGETEAKRSDVIREIMEDADSSDLPASSFIKELNDFGIESGIYKPFTKAQIDAIESTGGKKYDFKRGDKYYRFDSWKPIEGSLKADRELGRDRLEITEPPPMADVQKGITDLQTEFPGGLKVKIVESYHELPDSLHQAAYRQGANPVGVKGAVIGDTVYVNRQMLDSIADLRQLFLHEQAGHFATDRILGPKLEKFMDQVHESFKDDLLMEETRRLYQKATPTRLGREFVARLSENPKANPTAWNKIVAQFREWLRDIGWVKKVTENDIRVLLNRSMESLRAKEGGMSPEEISLSLKSAADAAGERYPSEKPKEEKKAVAGEPDAPAPQIAGGAERMRSSAERATTAESVPEVVQEQIKTAPESFYESQKYKSVEEAVAAAGDAELAAVPKDSNFHVASQLELSRRLFAEGKLEEGYRVFKEVSKQGTEWGQNINQFKMLKGTTPANIVDLVNEGLKESGRDPLTKKQMEDLGRVADESIQANRNLEKAKTDWKNDPTDANAKRAQDLLDKANAADLKTQQAMNNHKIKTWPRMLKTFAQGNPLTPISHVSNIVGNTMGATMEGGSRGIASVIDTIRAAIQGNERLISANPKGAVESMKGFGRGLKQAPGILTKGSGDMVKGESRASLQPLRSLAKAFAKNPDVPTVGGKVPLNERIRLATEGTFGIAPETMLRLLSVADKPAYEAARSRLIAEQARLKKVPSSQMSMAQKFPELFFDKETLRQIKEDSADAIFQRPSKAVENLQRLIREKGGDWGDLAFTIMVSPYKLTPWNLVVRTLQYNPLIAAAKTAMEAAKGNTRAAEISAGRMVLGSMIYTAGYFLYQNGLIGPSLEGRDEAQKGRLISGEVLPPNHVNVSGLNRLMKGEDPAFKPGDETVDLTRGGGAAGAIISSVANVGRKLEGQPEAGGGELAASLVRDGVLEQANFTINQSFLKGVTGLLDAIRNGNIGPYVTGVEQMLLNVATPNTLTALSRATRQYAPDMKADSVGQEFSNVVKNRFGILGADDYLPTKRDLFGEPMPQTPDGRNALLFHLFDISKGKQVTDDPVKLELYRLWRATGESEVIPSIPRREITVNNETYKIPTDLYGDFAEKVGKIRKEILDEMIQNPDFNELPDAQKIDLLERAYRTGADHGKAQFWDEHGETLKPVPKRAGFKQ